MGSCRPFEFGNITVVYDRCDSAPVCAGVIAKYKEVIDLAKQAEYRAGIAHLEIKQNLGFGTSTVRFMVRKVSMRLMAMLATYADAYTA